MSTPSSDPHFVVYCLDNLLPLLSSKPYPQRILDMVSIVLDFKFTIYYAFIPTFAVATTVRGTEEGGILIGSKLQEQVGHPADAADGAV